MRRCPIDESLGYSRSSLAGLDLRKTAADFKTQTGTKLGFTLTRETDGSSRLEVYFGFLTEERETPMAFHPPAQGERFDAASVQNWRKKVLWGG